MSNATCIECGAQVAWRSQRGSRLSDLRCRCGGKLRARRDEDIALAKGYKMKQCEVCGRRYRKHATDSERNICSYRCGINIGIYRYDTKLDEFVRTEAAK